MHIVQMDHTEILQDVTVEVWKCSGPFIRCQLRSVDSFRDLLTAVPRVDEPSNHF